MIYPCEKCTHDTGKCRCLDWQRWFSVEFEAEAAKVLAATHAEPLPAPPKIFYPLPLLPLRKRSAYPMCRGKIHFVPGLPVFLPRHHIFCASARSHLAAA